MNLHEPSGRASERSFVVPFSAVVLATIFLGTIRAAARPPELTEVFPPGAARGKSVTLDAAGTWDHWPVKVWVEGNGVEILAEKEKGKLKAVVASDAAPGVRWLRLYDSEGAAALRPFFVGVLPEQIEVEPNDEPRTPQRLVAPSATINGRLAKKGDVDGFSIRLTRGQLLVASVQAQRHLGSPMDAVLQVVNADGLVLAQNDDDIGSDPLIVFEPPITATYIVRLFAFPAKPDSSIQFAGARNYVYRLTLTTEGFLDYAFPLAVSSDGPKVVDAIGWNVPAAARRLAIPEAGTDEMVEVVHPALSESAHVRRVSFAATVESEPNDPAQPQVIPAQIAVSGRIDPPGDRDVFRMSLHKNDKRVIRIESRRTRQAARSDAPGA